MITFICGAVFGGSVVGLITALVLIHLRLRYPHLDAAINTVRFMRERGL